MRTGIIGTGRMAQAFGKYILKNGHTLTGIWGRDHEKTQNAAKWIGCSVYEQINLLVKASDVVLVAVTDDAIEEYAKKLSKLDVKDRFIGHLSGSLDSTVFEACQRKGAKIFSIHPLQTVPDPHEGLKKLKTACLMIEADDEIYLRLEQWLKPLGNPIGRVEKGQKALYHLGACMVSNYIMVLLQQGEEMLTQAGIEPKMAHEAILPLATATVESFKTKGAVNGLTGPVVRGDIKTIQKHLDALKKMDEKHTQKLVEILIKEAVILALKREDVNTEKVSLVSHLLDRE